MVDETAIQNGGIDTEPLSGPVIDYEGLSRAFGDEGDEEDSDELTFSSGVKVLCKGVPSFLIARGIAQIERPEIPVVMIEEKGRAEQNPNDPDYRKAVSEYNEAVMAAQLNISILFGTEIIWVPEEVMTHEDPAWLQMLAAAGLPVPESGQDRRLLWMRTIAMPRTADQWIMIYEVGRRSGTSEKDVADALARFRSAASRGTDSGVSAAGEGPDGDQPREEAGGDGAGI